MSDRHEWERDAVVWITGRAIEEATGGMADGVVTGPPDNPRLARAMSHFAAASDSLVKSMIFGSSLIKTTGGFQ